MIRDDDELLTIDEACAFVSGKTKPINRATTTGVLPEASILRRFTLRQAFRGL